MAIDALSSYLETVLQRDLPEDVELAAKHHLLDSLAASVSGSTLAAGRAGQEYIRQRADAGECTVMGTATTAGVSSAALANAMAAHADETDDSHEASRTHPGCSIVPAAFAAAERSNATAKQLLQAVVAGYDVAGRVNRMLWPDFVALRETLHSTHAFGALWGSAAAVGILARLSKAEFGHLFSYVAQQMAGTTLWLRDVAHVQKAYTFAGHGASAAIRCLEFVEAGWTGVADVTQGAPNILDVYGSDRSMRYLLVEGLGDDYVITNTNIKKYCAGSPVQAPLQGLFSLVAAHRIRTADITRVEIRLPESLATVVTDRAMPNISLPYLVHCALEDSSLSFAAAHDEDRFAAWSESDKRPQVDIVSDTEMEPVRQAVVVVDTRSGHSVSNWMNAVRGSWNNPMTTSEVVEKHLDLCGPILGETVSIQLADEVIGINARTSIGKLAQLLATN